MARIKVNIDKQRMMDSVSVLNTYEKGIYLSLYQYLFHQGQEEYLYDGIKGRRLTRSQLVQLLMDMNVSYDASEVIVSRFFEYGIFQQEGPHIYLIEIRRQKEVGRKKIRSSAFKKKELLDENSKDVISHLKIEQAEKSQADALFHDQALEVLTYLNTKSQRHVPYKGDAHLRTIIARLKEGHTVEQLKNIITYKTLQWKSTEWDKFLRPQTLFVPKHFLSYLNEAIEHFKSRENDKPHSLKDYIQKHFSNVSSIPIQMSSQECDRILLFAGGGETGKKKVIEKLKYMENSNLTKFRSVYLRLHSLIEKDKSKNFQSQ